METAGPRIIQQSASIQNQEATARSDPAGEREANLAEKPAAAGAQILTPPEPTPPGADFLTPLAELGVNEARLRSERTRMLGEISTLRTENRWEDLVALFHPVAEKAPEMNALGLATPIRAEIAFALGHLGRYDEAIELAHEHFIAAQALRPHQVTNYYRQGMLFKKLQAKPEEALPLFETAVRNWEAYSPEEQKARHQERKNYVKALYQAASCQLEAQRPAQALETLLRCLREDEESGHFSAVHKYFALGKVHFERGDLTQALQALDFAAVKASPEDDDFVFELLARIHLAQGDPISVGRKPTS